MRVLLTNHLPFHGSGAEMLELASGLIAAGHEVRALVVDCQSSGDETFPVRRVACRAGDRAADLPFDFPDFAPRAENQQTFETLSEIELADYREQIRSLLDFEVEEFDPQIIHAQHIWIQGHLALETGVPYVLSASGDDLAGYRHSVRFRALAQQAAENAGCILVASEALRREVLETFGEISDRIEVVPRVTASADDQQKTRWIGRILSSYQKVLATRFGESPL